MRRGSLERKAYQISYHTERRRKVKAKLIEMAGGKCQKCGYDKCAGALEFHHLRDKSFALSSNNLGKAWATVLAEFEKCILVCANCHREIHE